MDDHVNPLLSPLTPGFAAGRFVGVCGGLYRQYFPVGGNCNFQECKSPPSPTSARTWGSGALGHYIDRCISTAMLDWRDQSLEKLSDDIRNMGITTLVATGIPIYIRLVSQARPFSAQGLSFSRRPRGNCGKIFTHYASSSMIE